MDSIIGEVQSVQVGKKRNGQPMEGVGTRGPWHVYDVVINGDTFQSFNDVDEDGALLGQNKEWQWDWNPKFQGKKDLKLKGGKDSRAGSSPRVAQQQSGTEQEILKTVKHIEAMLMNSPQGEAETAKKFLA